MRAEIKNFISCKIFLVDFDAADMSLRVKLVNQKFLKRIDWIKLSNLERSFFYVITDLKMCEQFGRVFIESKIYHCQETGPR